MYVSELTSKQHWQNRVAKTAGEECLCDRNWRFDAVSETMFTPIGGTPEGFTGKTLSKVPLFHRFAGVLAAIPLFDCSLRLVRFQSEIWIDGANHARTIELWPILPSDDEPLLHVVKYPPVGTVAQHQFPGFRLTNLCIALLNGRIIEAGNAVIAR